MTTAVKPLLFWISPTDTRCVTRSDAAAAFVVVSMMHVLAAWSVMPAVMPAGSFSSPRAVALLLVVQMAIVVLTLAMRWMAITYFVWALSGFLGSTTRRVLPFFGVVVMADAVTAAQMAVASIVARVSQSGARTYLEAPRMGLDLAFRAESPFGAAVLSSLDGFAAWYAIIVVLGLHAAAGVRRRDGMVIVAAMWLVSVALRVILRAVAG